MNFPQIIGILTGLRGNSFKVLQNSGIPQDLESAGFGILHKLLLLFLEILKFLGTQFSVVHWGGVDIFWNSPLHSWLSAKKYGVGGGQKTTGHCLFLNNRRLFILFFLLFLKN